MSEEKYQVYCHLNKANGKVYFGATKNTVIYLLTLLAWVVLTVLVGVSSAK